MEKADVVDELGRYAGKPGIALVERAVVRSTACRKSELHRKRPEEQEERDVLEQQRRQHGAEAGRHCTDTYETGATGKRFGC